MARNIVWRFKTRNFVVQLVIEPEEMDPENHFDDEEIIQGIRDGVYTWFCARVEVIERAQGEVVGWDSLGACSYNSIEEFYTSHRDQDPMNRNCTIMRANHPSGPMVSICHYFPDMVRQAVAHALSRLEELRAIKIRSRA